MRPHYSDYIADVKTIDMREAVRFYGFEPDRAGYICCPFHKEKTGSLKVWSDHFKCFGCGQYGDIISFVQMMLHTDFPGAMKAINRDFGLNLPFEEKSSLALMRENKTRRARSAAEAEAERHRVTMSDLLNAWAECDRIILDHPVPDNEMTAQAYSDREWLNYLIDNYNEDEGLTDDYLQLDGLYCRRHRQTDL